MLGMVNEYNDIFLLKSSHYHSDFPAHERGCQNFNTSDDIFHLNKNANTTETNIQVKVHIHEA